MSVSYGGSSITFEDGSIVSSGSQGFKNKIINGHMMIDQRNAGTSVTPTNGAYTLDRWNCGITQASKFTVQQNAASVTPPAGFKNYLGITSSSAYSIGAGDIFYVKQPIEGFNVSDLGFGAAGASTVTLSFWVRSSLTGSFGGALQNSAENRSYPFSYTISTANTWEYETVTIAGDTSGTWLTTNGIGLSVVFGLGNGATYSGTANAWAGAQYFAPTGSVSVVGTNGATFYITGVQLEKGTTASSFEFRSYGKELMLCKRYYEKSFPLATAPANAVYSVWAPAISNYSDNLNIQLYIPYSVEKRTTSPTLTLYGGSSGKWQSQKTDGTWGTILGSTYSINNTSTGFSLNNSDWNGSSSWQAVTAGTGRMARGDWTSDAEL